MKKITFVFGIICASFILLGCEKPIEDTMDTPPPPPVTEVDTGTMTNEELPPVEEVLPPAEEGMMEEMEGEEPVEEPTEGVMEEEVMEEKDSFLDSLKNIVKSDKEVAPPEEEGEVVEPEPVEVPTEEEATEYEDAETCRAEGGSWIRGQDTARTQLCLKPYPDAGAPCEDSEDCNGKCLGRFDDETEEYEGYCQKNNNPFGCFIEMKDGEAQEEECLR